MSSDSDKENPDGQGPESDQAVSGSTSKLPPELELRLRAFRDRMTPRTEIPPLPTEADQREYPPPSPLEEHEHQDFLAASNRALKGRDRIAYLAQLTNWGKDENPNSVMNYEASLRLVKALLQKVDSLDANILSGPNAQTISAVFLHWLWLIDETSWASEEFSEREIERLNVIRHIFQLIFSHSPGRAANMAALGQNNHDGILPMSAIKFLPAERITISGMPTEACLTVLDLSPTELRKLSGKTVLFIGPSASPLVESLKQVGANASTVDDPQEIKRKFPTQTFQRIFGIESFMHGADYLEYAKDPAKLWNRFSAALEKLNPEHGELRCSTMLPFYAPKLMERFVMPMLIALKAGQFEVIGAYDEEGKLSFQEFIAHQFEPFAKSRSPVLRIRRHPISDLAKAAHAIKSQGV